MSVEKFPARGRLLEYDHLTSLLLARITKGLPLPDFWSLEKDEQRIAFAVTKATGMSLERWDNLTLAERVPWLQATLDAIEPVNSNNPPPLSPNEQLQLDDESARIVRALHSQHPKLLTVVEVEANTDGHVSAGTVKARLRELIDAGIAHRPKGKNQGAGLTTEGLEIAAALPPAQG